MACSQVTTFATNYRNEQDQIPNCRVCINTETLETTISIWKLICHWRNYVRIMHQLLWQKKISCCTTTLHYISNFSEKLDLEKPYYCSIPCTTISCAFPLFLQLKKEN